jgi:hypothetical protein
MWFDKRYTCFVRNVNFTKPIFLYLRYLCVYVPSEDSPTNHQCPMVRNKSYFTQGSVYPTSPNCPSGTNRHSSHSTAISTKPTDGTNSRSAKQQAIAKKMDTWCDLLRQRRWTSPRLPPTRILALTHRYNNKSFLWLLILELKQNKIMYNLNLYLKNTHSGPNVGTRYIV